MSVGLSIHFLAGRYHATPWDHQVNEGVVEWPPSPWRILRSLVAAYYRLPSPPARQAVNQLLTHLAAHAPGYDLPRYSTAHTRHYMPVWKEGKATTTKVFDTFHALGGGALADDALVQVVWPVDLDEGEQKLLALLCQQVSYLGRAESWVELSVIQGEYCDCNALPATSDHVAGWHAETAKVLIPLSAEGLEGFKAAISALPQPKKGKAKWQAPKDIMAALELDIGHLHSQGWNGIPGARWENYLLRRQFRPLSRHLEVIYPTKAPTFARFALASNVLPKLTEAISLGERFRQALMAWSRDEAGCPDLVFSGRDAAGQPAQGHQHAWYLPEPNSQGRINHMVVYAAGGFHSERAIAALQNLPKVWGHGGFDIQTVLIALGQREIYGAEERQAEGRSLVVGYGRTWHSLTPMVLPRHPKRKINSQTGFQVDGTEHQALRLLRLLKKDLPADGTEVRVMEENKAWLGWVDAQGTLQVKVRGLGDEEAQAKQISRWPWYAFKRQRSEGKGEKSSNRGYWLEIEFAEPQWGPIALGYAAHFGLGLFVPHQLT